MKRLVPCTVLAVVAAVLALPADAVEPRTSTPGVRLLVENGSTRDVVRRQTSPVTTDRRVRIRPTKVSFGDLPPVPARKAVLHPRSTTVRDSLVFHPGIRGNVRTARLVVTGPSGDVVLRRELPRRAFPTVRWDGRDTTTGRPLPPGRYRVDVDATDSAGNRVSAEPVTVRISRDRLVWVEKTRQVVPDEVDHASTCGTWGDSNGCGDYDPCGQVEPSALFPGGLSHQGVDPCPGLGSTGAGTDNWFAVPEAVRGVAAIRVAFTGAPTHAAESDPGTVRAYSFATSSEVVATSATGASTGWVLEPWGGTGSWFDPIRQTPRMPPSALWSFSTTGTDSFDVTSYTVDLRYLAVAD